MVPRPTPEAPRPRILVVEDSENIAALLTTTFRFEGFEVDACADGAVAVETVAAFAPDVVVLDVMLPGIDGFEVQRRLVPSDDGGPSVLVLTARDAPGDAVRSLELGADDYVTKPFSVEELVARVHRILRRRAAGSTTGSVGGLDATPAATLEYADLRLDEGTRDVTRGDRYLELTPREFDLLHYLLRNAGRVVTRSQILDGVWEYDFGGDGNIVERYVSNLRRKVDSTDPPLLQTVRGVGYALRLPRTGA